MVSNILMALSAFTVAGIILLVSVILFKRKIKLDLLEGIKVRLERLILPVGSLIFVLSALAILPFLELKGTLGFRISQLISLWLVVSLGLLGINAVQMFKEAILKRYNIDVSDNLKARKMYTQIGVMEKIINVGIIIFTFSCMIMLFPRMRQVGLSLLASAGVMGIVLGLAAQRTLGNLIAGIQIAMTQPIRLDDALVVENEWGWGGRDNPDICRRQDMGLKAPYIADILFYRKTLPELDADVFGQYWLRYIFTRITPYL